MNIKATSEQARRGNDIDQEGFHEGIGLTQWAFAGASDFSDALLPLLFPFLPTAPLRGLI